MNDRGGLLSAGGILSIIVGAFEIITGVAMAALIWIRMAFWQPRLPFFPGFGGGFNFGANLNLVVIIGIVLAVLGVVAMVGGISAIRRRNFGLSLAGAICALLPINFLGILAVVFVSLAKREFK